MNDLQFSFDQTKMSFFIAKLGSRIASASEASTLRTSNEIYESTIIPFIFSHFFMIHGVERPLELAPCVDAHSNDRKWHGIPFGVITAVVVVAGGTR